MTQPPTNPLKSVQSAIPKSQTMKINALPEEARAYCEQVSQIFERRRQHKLLWRYEVGEILAAASSNLDKQADKKPSLRSIADNLVRYFAEVVAVPNRTLSDCLRLVRTFGQERYQRLVESEGITWPHVLYLLNVNGEKLRTEMETKLIAERWGAERLKAEIRARLENQRRGTGRKLKAPESLNHALNQLTSSADKFTRQMTETWFGDRFDIATEIESLTPSKTSVRTPDQIRASVTALKSLIAAAQMGIRKLKPLAKGGLAKPQDRQASVAKTRQRTVKPETMPRSSI